MPALYNASTYETVENTKRLKVLQSTYTNEQNTNDKYEDEELAGPVGFLGRHICREPTTYGSEGRRSTGLSHGPVFSSAPYLIFVAKYVSLLCRLHPQSIASRLGRYFTTFCSSTCYEVVSSNVTLIAHRGTSTRRLVWFCGRRTYRRGFSPL